MAGGNTDKRKRNSLDDLPYYMQAEQVRSRRNLGDREKYSNDQMNAKIYADKMKEIQDRKPKTPMQQRDRNRADLQEEGADRAEIARSRKQRQIADQLLNNKRKNKRAGGER